MAATFWRGLLIGTSITDDAEQLQEEAIQFQVSCFHRGIEKVAMVVCHHLWESESQDKFRGACEERGIPVVFIQCQSSDLQNPYDWCRKTDGMLRTLVRTTKVEVHKQISARLESDAVEQDVMASQDESALPSSSQRGGTDTTVKRRQLTDAKLRKQRADCSLLLGYPLAALSHYATAVDIYRQLGDVASQASCLECQAASLVLWAQGRKGNDTTPQSASPAYSPTNGNLGLPPVLDTLVKDVFMPKRGGTSILQQLWVDKPTAPQGSNLFVSALQDLAHQFEQGGSITDRSKAKEGRRSSVFAGPVNDSPLLICLAAATAKLKEATTIYARFRGSDAELPSMITNLCAISLLISVDDIGPAIEMLSNLVEECFHNKSPLVTYIVMACASCCWSARSPRRLTLILHQLCLRLADSIGGFEDAMQSEIWRTIYRSSLLLSPWVHLPPAIFLELDPARFMLAQPGTALKDGGLSFAQAALMSVKHILKSASKFVSISGLHTSLSAGMSVTRETQEFLEEHVAAARIYPDTSATLALSHWPALQAAIIDRLRKAADKSDLPLQVLWYAYAALLYLHAAVDTRSQTAAQRTMAAKEMQVTSALRVAPLIGEEVCKGVWSEPCSTPVQNDPSINSTMSFADRVAQTMSKTPKHIPSEALCGATSKRTVPWLVPPSLTLVSPASLSTQNFTSAVRHFGPMNYSSTRRRLTALKNWVVPPILRATNVRRGGKDSKCLQFTCVGGLGNGAFPYVPLLLGLDPWKSRRLDSVNPAAKFVKLETLPVTSEVFLKPKAAAHQNPSRRRSEAYKSQESIGEKTFLYQPWRSRGSMRKPSVKTGSQIYWSQNDIHTVAVCVKNPLSIDILLDHCRVLTAGCQTDSQLLTVGLPPSGPHEVTFEALMVPKEPGTIRFIGLAYILSRVDTAQLLLWDTPNLHEALSKDEEVTASQIDRLLETSAFASVDVVPPVPVLETRTQQTQFRTKPRTATPSAQLTPLVNVVLPAGISGKEEVGVAERALRRYELFVLSVRVANVSGLDVDSLKFGICEADSPAESVLECSDNLIYFSNSHLDRCIRGVDENFSALISEDDALLTAKERVFGATELVLADLEIPNGVQKDFHLQIWARPEISSFVLRLMYSQATSDHCRVDSIPITLQMQKSLSLRHAAFFVDSSLDFENVQVELSSYSEETQQILRPMVERRGAGLRRECHLDSNHTILALILENETTDCSFELTATLTENWDSVLPYTLVESLSGPIFTQSKTQIARNELHARWLLHIRRFIPSELLQTVIDTFCSPINLMSALLNVVWQASDGSQGYLSLDEFITEEDKPFAATDWNALLKPEVPHIPPTKTDFVAV
eukprot:Blabericola_migrator_1__7939@NODE_406_length_8824_cov_44_431426_g320_i0_p1_GENE_NODE_406_length_8824_cov_44_431426_g320_i0NODE_406_length_8824_cov_44_431426_g320_i0_p1_ORF_typecomplete_len1456_score267_80TRAPPC9Trs120/PF08626_11/1_1e21Ribosomal_L37ae/PF01780_19/1_3e06DUF2538/PF10804_8/0_12_NODE_406_length_8824_cov_44_431426_g320_i03234369